MKYIDSSAFVKYYSTEKGSEKVNAIIDRAKDGKEKLISSILLIGEVISAFDKMFRQKLITKEEFMTSVKDFINDINELTEKTAIILEDVYSMNMIFAVDYIINYHLTVNDALHLYTALVNKKKIEKFISSDKNLNNAATKEGMSVFNPEE